MNQQKNRQKGFTLIEILVVIGIIALLATVVIVAINPARQFAQARNTQRVSNVGTILNGLGQNLADNKGVSTCTGITSTATDIGTGSGLVDLTSCLTTYVPDLAFLFDPTGGSAADTKYTIKINAANQYTVCAPNYNETALGSPGSYCTTR